MRTRITTTPLRDLVVVDIDYFKDERGFLIESWHKRDFKKAGLDITFVQEVQSSSKYKVLRGLHYQNMDSPVAKLIRCIRGEVLTVALDLRISSPTFGKWHSIKLTAENKTQLYIPVGFAFGFAVLSDVAEMLYKFTGFYQASAEATIAWNDPDLAIQWPFTDPILSGRDKKGIPFSVYKKNPVFS